MLASLVAGLLLPGFSQLQTGPRGGIVLQGMLPGAERPGLVYLPPGFTTAQRYPVIYLLHGMPGSPSEYLEGAGFLDAADQGIANGTLRPFVAIAPAAGPSHVYNGEWAGPWERDLVDRIVPWVDATLPTLADAPDRVLAGLSAGGYGAVDIALRNPDVFGAVESWSGYFEPLHDGPFKHASRQTLAAHDPVQLARSLAPVLRRNRTRFFLSSGPPHSHWFRPEQTIAFTRELRAEGVPVAFHLYANARGEYRNQLATGLAWAFR